MPSDKNLVLPMLICGIMACLTSCKHIFRYNYHLENEKTQADAIRLNHIKRATIIKSYLDSNGLDTLRRLDRIEVFNGIGLCIVEITPEYLEARPQRRTVKGGVFDLRDLDTRPTSIYLNVSDTLYNEYDSAYLLIRRMKISPYGKVTEEWMYDDSGNEISYCHKLEYTPMKCIYASYIYENGKVISRTDSNDDYGTSSSSTHFTYVYDARGNVLKDGRYKYELDDQNRVLETIPETNGYSGERVKRDAKGRVTEEIELYYNDVQKNVQESDEIKRYKYDSRNLVVEETKIINGRAAEVLSYSYE